MRVLFLVQGEGRGHMTQAMALSQMLRHNGHQVVAALVGKNESRAIPAFFGEEIKCPVWTFPSPGFVPDSSKKGIRNVASLMINGVKLPKFWRTLTKLHAQIELYSPDLIVNFYEVMGGLYALRYRPEIPIVAVAHQYMFLHKNYPWPAGHFMPKFALKLFTRLTALGAKKKLALSVYHENKQQDIHVMPPLLRHSVLINGVEKSDPFLLVYLLNQAYAAEVIAWHKQNPEVKIHCFWDKNMDDVTETYDETLTFHRLCAVKFVQMMKQCSAVVSTAGFESVCEAMYLGKPVFMVPVLGHFEQFCNAHDAVRLRAGLAGESFQLDDFLDWVRREPSEHPKFVEWVNRADDMIVGELESVLVSEPGFVFAPA